MITGVIYWVALGALDAFFFAGLSATIVLYQIVNFHHYVVDAIIWKVRESTDRQGRSVLKTDSFIRLVDSRSVRDDGHAFSVP